MVTAGVVVGSGSLRVESSRYGVSLVKVSVVIVIRGVNAWSRAASAGAVNSRRTYSLLC